MTLQESGEMYLETIYRLTEQKGNVRSIDVSESMGFSKPSVSRAIGLLRGGGYITVDKDGFISLTESGKKTAEKIYTRHKLITAFLMKIGVCEEVASRDACKIEHVISDESFAALTRAVSEKESDK